MDPELQELVKTLTENHDRLELQLRDLAESHKQLDARIRALTSKPTNGKV